MLARQLALAFALLFAFASCGPSDLTLQPSRGNELADNDDWKASIDYYREALKTDPDNTELRAGFFSVSERAVQFHLESARKFSDKGDLGAAEGVISRGLRLLPDSNLLREELRRLNDLRKARVLFRDAKVSANLGRRERAFGFLERSLELDPSHSPSLKLYQELIAADFSEKPLEPIRLQTGAPVSINFKNASFKEASLALGKAYGVNMIFDADLEDRPVSIFAENVSFEQGLTLLLKSNRAFFRRLGKNSIVIAGDLPEKRGEYSDYVVRTFYLRSARAQEMADMLTRTLGIQNVSANEEQNALTIRETPSRLQLVSQLLASNDRATAEVIMEVEILEVNRTKSEQLGLDFGSQISITPPGLEVGQVIPLSGFGNTLETSILTLPAVTFRYFKQDVDGTTLAAPRIRTINKKEAIIHVGDRVPLRSATIQDSTGQTRTTFEYRDVGIKLNVTPEVKLNGAVAVDMALEVSTLGQNLGTTDEPAFAIGTRNVSTEMILADGETAVIGGLIRDQDRDTVQRVPGLGDIPIIGKIFRQRDGQNDRTDILLTLTPRLVRGLDLPSVAESEFYSGTGNQVTDENPYEFLAATNGDDLPTIRLDLSGSSLQPSSAALRSGIAAPSPSVTNPASGASAPVLGFVRSSYVVKAGEKVDVSVTAAGFPSDISGSLIVRYRRDLVRPVEVATSANIPYKIEHETGQILMELTPRASGAQSREIAKIQFEGLKKGLSYLIFANSIGDAGREGLPKNTELRTSRIAVQ